MALAFVLLLHGGWDTIIMALLFWSIVLAGPPLAVIFGIVWFARRRRARKSLGAENSSD